MPLEMDRGPWQALSLGDAAGPDATGANSNSFVHFSDNHSNSLKIGIPSASRQIVRVTDSVAVNRTFVTYFATCHKYSIIQIKGKL